MDELKVLKNQLGMLNLKHLSAQLETVLLDTRHADKSHIQFLQDVLGVEITRRRQLSMEKRLRHANFPIFDKPLQLDTYDFAKRQGVAKRQIVELTSNFLWIEKAYNVLFFGGSGLGKSFLACYIGYKAVEAGYDVMFISMNNLAHLLKTESMLSRSRGKMKRLRGCDLLILDEVANTVLDRQEGNQLYQMVSDFYQQTSMIITANKGFEDWERTLGDKVVTAAVMDRLLHNCEIFNLAGDSWRLEAQRSILGGLLKGGGKDA